MERIASSKLLTLISVLIVSLVLSSIMECGSTIRELNLIILAGTVI